MAWERSVLRALNAAQDRAVVLLREKPLRHNDKEKNVHSNGQEKNHQGYVAGCRSTTCRHRSYAARHACKTFFAHAIKPAVFLRFAIPQQTRAHHRRGRERNDERNENGGREHDGKFAEQAPDDAAHQQNRNEDRHERKADGEHGETDFARAFQRRLPWASGLFPDGATRFR